MSRVEQIHVLSLVFPLISPLLFVLVLLSRAYRLHEITTSVCVALVERWRHFLAQSCTHALLSLSHRPISPPSPPPTIRFTLTSLSLAHLSFSMTPFHTTSTLNNPNSIVSSHAFRSASTLTMMSPVALLLFGANPEFSSCRGSGPKASNLL